MKPIQILIVDDHSLFREGMNAILTSVPEINILGEAGTGEEALALAAELAPDVILMDIEMPDMNGIEATRRILQDHPDTAIIIVTMLEDDESLFSAMRAGARGYVLKGADKDEMLKCIFAVAQGDALFGSSIASRLMSFFKYNDLPITNEPGKQEFPELTDRERQILEFIARGDTNDQIAKQLNLSLKTIQNHVSNIYNKMQVVDRVQAVLRAREAGFGNRGRETKE